MRARSGAPAGGRDVQFSSGLAPSRRRFNRRSGSGRKRASQRVTGQPVRRVAFEPRVGPDDGFHHERDVRGNGQFLGQPGP